MRIHGHTDFCLGVGSPSLVWRPSEVQVCLPPAEVWPGSLPGVLKHPLGEPLFDLCLVILLLPLDFALCAQPVGKACSLLAGVSPSHLCKHENGNCLLPLEFRLTLGMPSCGTVCSLPETFSRW